jgi:hypothetical protein
MSSRPTSASFRRHRLLALLAALSLVAVGTLAACGSDASTDGSSGGSTSTESSGAGGGADSGDSDAGRVKLAQCLRDNGVDLPDNIGNGGAPPANLDREKIQELLQNECADVAEGAFGDVSGGDQEAFRDAFAVYSQCMRDNGVDLPDIGSGGAGADLPDPGSIDRDAPSFKKAQSACADKLPQGLPGGGN